MFYSICDFLLQAVHYNNMMRANWHVLSHLFPRTWSWQILCLKQKNNLQLNGILRAKWAPLKLVKTLEGETNLFSVVLRWHPPENILTWFLLSFQLALLHINMMEFWFDFYCFSFSQLKLVVFCLNPSSRWLCFPNYHRLQWK